MNVEPITDAEMDRRLSDYFDAYYPERYYARRSEAWQTIGALPGDVGYLEALDAYQQGQVLGFYNSQNEELVYTGDAELDRIEQFVLAHELTHAIDDQHFDLDRLDDLVVRCEDEPFEAALGIVEGSANHFATQVLIRYPSLSDVGSIPGGGPPARSRPSSWSSRPIPTRPGSGSRMSCPTRTGPPRSTTRSTRSRPRPSRSSTPSKFPDEVGVSVDVADFGPTFGPDVA